MERVEIEDEPSAVAPDGDVTMEPAAGSASSSSVPPAASAPETAAGPPAFSAPEAATALEAAAAPARVDALFAGVDPTSGTPDEDFADMLAEAMSD